MRCDRENISRRAEALFHPSFDPLTLLRVIADTQGTVVEVTSAEHVLAQPFTYRCMVEPNCALQFWNEMDAVLTAPLELEKMFGLDGTTVQVDCRTPTGRAKFEVWSPKPATPVGRLVGLIYDLSREVASDTSAINCLKQLGSYLRR